MYLEIEAIKMLVVETIMTQYYDETIFTDGRSLQKFSQVNAFNRADTYLLELNGIAAIGYKCDGRTEKSTNSIANINPRQPCRGINIYTLNMLNKKISQVEPFNQITIFNGEDGVPVDLFEYTPETIYTIGQLTSIESAIIIKYYAINNENVTITSALYNFIKPHIQDQRSWFKNISDIDVGFVQNDNKELLHNSQIVSMPINTFSGPEIHLH